MKPLAEISHNWAHTRSQLYEYTATSDMPHPCLPGCLGKQQSGQWEGRGGECSKLSRAHLLPPSSLTFWAGHPSTAISFLLLSTYLLKQMGWALPVATGWVESKGEEMIAGGPKGKWKEVSRGSASGVSLERAQGAIFEFCKVPCCANHSSP